MVRDIGVKRQQTTNDDYLIELLPLVTKTLFWLNEICKEKQYTPTAHSGVRKIKYSFNYPLSLEAL